MANVPVYEPQVQLQPMPNARQNVDTRGAFGPDVRGFAVAMDRLGEQFDEYAAKKAYTQYSSALAEYVENPEKGLMLRKGENVLGMAQDFNKTAQELQKQYLGGLSERAAARASEFMAHTTTGYLKTINTHQRNEIERTFDNQDIAARKIAQGKAVRFFGMPEGEMALQELDAINESFARRKGISRGTPDYVILEQEGFEPVTKQLVDSMLDAGNTAGATEYVNRMLEEGKIGGMAGTELREKIKNFTSLEQAQAAADDYMRRGVGLQAAFADIEQKYSGKQEKEVKAEVESRFKAREYSQNLWRDNAFNEGVKYMRENINNPQAIKTYIAKHTDAETYNKLYDVYDRLTKERPKTEAEKVADIAQSISAMNSMRRAIAGEPLKVTTQNQDGTTSEREYKGFSDENAVIGAAVQLGITEKKDITELVDIFNGKDAVEGVNQATVDKHLMRLSESKDIKSANAKYPGMYKFVIENWPKGKPYTEETLSRLIALGITSGEVQSGVWYQNDKEGVSYAEAKESGELDKWVMTDEERAKIIQTMTEWNEYAKKNNKKIVPINEQTIMKYRRKSLGL